MLKVSVVVPALNAAETIGLCIESLVRQRYPASEVIVVDNGSRDRTAEIVSHWASRPSLPPVVLLTEERRGPSAARNRGIHAAHGEIVAFTDADCVADPEWLHDLAPAFADDAIAAVAGDIRGYQPRTLLEKFQSLFTLRSSLTEEQVCDRYTLTTGGFPTANLAVRKKILEEIGGFNESLPIYTEDHDLCRRIYAAGGRIKTTPRGTIYHIHRPTLSRFLRQNFGFGRGHAQILVWCFSRLWKIQALGRTVHSETLPGKVWIDLSLVDKKIGVIVAAGFVYPPLWLCGPLYLWHLTRHVHRRAAAEGMVTTVPEEIAMVGLFLLKCLAIDCGRWYGSLRYRVLCV